MAMITFQPDMVEPELRSNVETALFLGVRGNPPLESTQLRWQVKVGPDDIVQLESGGTYLEHLGGALFLTTKEPRPEIAPGETPQPIGWIKWIAEQGRRSFQVQLGISRIGFDRICALAEKGRYPHAILTFEEGSGIDYGLSPNGEKKIWKNVESSVALVSEFTLKYDFSPDA
jgi:hypothetical protein